MLMVFVIICLSFPPLSSADVHSLQYFYTGLSGIKDFPEFISVGKVNGIQITSYDSSLKKTIPIDWINDVQKDDPKYAWGQIEASLGYMEAFKASITTLKKRFNQAEGVHVLQKTYGCRWDDETNATTGFEQFGYDGEDFMKLDLVNMRWKADVPQAEITTEKWNRDVIQLLYRKDYFNNICVDWLKKYRRYGKSTFRTVHPEVSLLKNSTGVVVCHATGFYPAVVHITWKRDGKEMQGDVYINKTLPNEDGTFQKRAVLTVPPEERKKHHYSCEVTHMNGEPIILLLEEGNISLIMYVMCGIAVVIIVIIIIIVSITVMKKTRCKKTLLYDPSSQHKSNML